MFSYNWFDFQKKNVHQVVTDSLQWYIDHLEWVHNLCDNMRREMQQLYHCFFKIINAVWI